MFLVGFSITSFLYRGRIHVVMGSPMFTDSTSSDQVYAVFSDSPFKVFVDALENEGIVKAVCVPLGSKTYSNTASKKGDIYNEAMKYGAKGLPFLKVSDDGNLEGIQALVSSLDAVKKEQLLYQLSARPGHLILFAVGQKSSVNKTLDRLQVYVANELGLVDPVNFLVRNALCIWEETMRN